ncbi:Hypothetical protein, predicted lipoprotein [Mycoplasmopsis agalactiae 14628]|uniref:Lipoprotein n=1 Tax=Mycoplasmopsis agalactiae 14628 TaxID=1110504 RepID=I5D5U0_MYCAA|nr:variable surface lipoprotein [Mycoplasmopsis agalactiae]EIN15049.1 Hypothetical protein, predicted lipoprotein [Mycoplasmopsis agalactiae 14628]
MKKAKFILGALVPISTIPFIAASCNEIELGKTEANKQDENNNKTVKKVEKTESHNLTSSSNIELEDKKENETIEKDKSSTNPEKTETPEAPKTKEKKLKEDKSKEKAKKEEKKNEEDPNDDISLFDFNNSSKTDKKPEDNTEILDKETLAGYKLEINSEIGELEKEVTNYNGFIKNELKSQFMELKGKLVKLLEDAKTEKNIEKIINLFDFFNDQFEGYNIKIESMKKK